MELPFIAGGPFTISQWANKAAALCAANASGQTTDRGGLLVNSASL
jgi:hypothetical protein